MLTVSASRVVFVARRFSEMLGTPEGARHFDGDTRTGTGLLFFGYFLFAEAKERLEHASDEKPPGNPRLGHKIIIANKHPAKIAWQNQFFTRSVIDDFLNGNF
jgi:hypothetical protein